MSIEGAKLAIEALKALYNCRVDLLVTAMGKPPSSDRGEDLLLAAVFDEVSEDVGQKITRIFMKMNAQENVKKSSKQFPPTLRLHDE